MKPNVKKYFFIGLKALLSLVFMMAGAAKLSGADEMIAIYEQIGIGQWFRYLTGCIEVTAAIGLLINKTSLYASAAFVRVMIGAVFAHLFLIGGSPIPALVLGVICMFIVSNDIDNYIRGSN